MSGKCMDPGLKLCGTGGSVPPDRKFCCGKYFYDPGLGREFVNSIANRDYTLIMGLTIFMGIVVIGVNLAVDLLCVWLDPRIQKSYSKD